jgi:DNA-binding NarL/FixJ family response regulator
MSSDSSPIRILEVDDHQLIRLGIATLLLPESDMKLVGEASNGREAISKFRECDPDITLMDLVRTALSRISPSVPIPTQC